MKFKIYILLILCGLITVQIFQSCNKYPDGDGVSLRSRADRVANTWQVENYKVNGSDLTSLVNNYTETYTKDGKFSYQWGNIDGTGSWTFQNKDTEIKLNGNDQQSSRTLYILKLEDKTLWYYYMDNEDKHELHLIEQ